MSIAASQLQVLQSKSLPSVVRDEILRFILHGTYSPGSKLGEEELAGILGVSRAPILAQVDETGLLKATKGFSNGAAADAQNAGQFLFSQLRSRRIGPVQDEPQDLVADDAGERFRLEYLQLCCGD